MLALVDPYILAFSAITVVVTVFMGFWAARKSRSAADFFVAGRGVSVGWNASAISGEYLSAASFMGVAGMVMSSGYDALWYPVCYACGYLFLLLFIAGPLRRFGAYTIPDFAEGRYDSPVFRKIAVIFVLFIGFFYTMPQMKGAGTTLAYIFKDIDFMGHKGLPYWVGVVLVGAVITLNVALGGMKGITLVQAFQYWAKMFAISVPVFVLMSVYGSYGKQLGQNGVNAQNAAGARPTMVAVYVGTLPDRFGRLQDGNAYIEDGGMYRGTGNEPFSGLKNWWTDLRGREREMTVSLKSGTYSIPDLLNNYTQSHVWQRGLRHVSGFIAADIGSRPIAYSQSGPLTRDEFDQRITQVLADNGLTLIHITPEYYKLVPTADAAKHGIEFRPTGVGKSPTTSKSTVTEAPVLSEPIRLPVAAHRTMADVPPVMFSDVGHIELRSVPADQLWDAYEFSVGRKLLPRRVDVRATVDQLLDGQLSRAELSEQARSRGAMVNVPRATGTDAALKKAMEKALTDIGITLVPVGDNYFRAIATKKLDAYFAALDLEALASGPEKPLPPVASMSLQSTPGIVGRGAMVVLTPGDLAGIAVGTTSTHADPYGFDADLPIIGASVRVGDHQVSLPQAAVKMISDRKIANSLANKPDQLNSVSRQPLTAKAPKDETWLNPFGPLTTKAAKAAHIEGTAAKPYALLYTYSLIIALVCGTAGLPHILVRFYTNPDGVSAKRTTMWVMILIGIFYVFPPVFGALGRNLMPSLYEGAGVGGTDGLVLKLPTILNDRFGVLGSVLSGITCAGAFAAFMSTFSGLLVSMTGALAHDVYGRILRPKSTAAERMQMFKWCAVAIGIVAVLLGTLVENFEINFMVGQAFAIAAASYFPLLFMSVWWRGMTTRGAATGMLTGGLCAVAAISVASWTTFFTAQAAKFKSLGVAEPGWFAALKPYALTDFWAAHPLLRILAEQPAIWAVPLAITLMILVSKLTKREVPADIRMKMLVLHAPEALGLKQEYIRDHDGAH
jgi:Na+(H+)/acetate symporter ActP